MFLISPIITQLNDLLKVEGQNLNGNISPWYPAFQQKPNCVSFISEVSLHKNLPYKNTKDVSLKPHVTFISLALCLFKKTHSHTAKAFSQSSKYLNLKRFFTKEQISTGKEFRLDFFTQCQRFNTELPERAVQDCLSMKTGQTLTNLTVDAV